MALGTMLPGRVAAQSGEPGAVVPEARDGWGHADGGPTEPTGAAWVERTQGHMGTRLRVRVAAATRAGALAASDSAFAAVRRTDALLSTWRASELSAVNEAPVGRPAPLSEDLRRILAKVDRLSALTGGAFDPAVGALIDAWDVRGAGRRPTAAALAAARAASGRGSIRLDVEGGTVTRLRQGSWLDAGAFGKGAALDAAVASLREAGASAAVLNFGGQVQVLGEAVSVPVASPEARAMPVAVLRVRGAVATTSSSERWLRVDGDTVGHVLDPRTGVPVRPWGSVTVVAQEGLEADALSTGLFVLGPEGALAWASDRSVAVLVVERNGDGLRARWTDALTPALTCLAGDIQARKGVPRCEARSSRDGTIDTERSEEARVRKGE